MEDGKREMEKTIEGLQSQIEGLSNEVTALRAWKENHTGGLEFQTLSEELERVRCRGKETHKRSDEREDPENEQEEKQRKESIHLQARIERLTADIHARDITIRKLSQRLEKDSEQVGLNRLRERRRVCEYFSFLSSYVSDGCSWLIGVVLPFQAWEGEDVERDLLGAVR